MAQRGLFTGITHWLPFPLCQTGSVCDAETRSWEGHAAVSVPWVPISPVRRQE